LTGVLADRLNLLRSQDGLFTPCDSEPISNP